MDDTNYIDILGKYFGESELTEFLSRFEIASPPKIARGDRDVSVLSVRNGIEFTFTAERFLDVAFREYPDGALVLSNIFFHGTKTAAHESFRHALPLGLLFSMDKDAVTEHLGKPQWTNSKGTLFRWDAEKHCVSSRFDENGQLDMIGVQLPNKYTLNLTAG